MRSKTFFDSSRRDLTAGIVSCGGLCPGLNSVIRSLVFTLTYTYGVKIIKGFKYGYEGLGETTSFVLLDPEVVSQIHHFGGSFIG
jgi:6-phosphofructokinase 1